MSRIPLSLRLRRAIRLLARMAARSLGLRKTVYVTSRAREYRDYWSRAAELVGARLFDLSGDIWEVRRGKQSTRIALYVTEADDPVTLQLAGDKVYCLALAEKLGVPTARLAVFDLGSLEVAERFLGKYVGGVVVKPAGGSSSGLGITTQIRSARALKRAAVLASLFSDRLLLERTVMGESCRLVFLNGRFVHAVRRTGEAVVGDGSSTLADLIRRTRKGSADLGDATTLLTIRDQGLDMDYVPASGERVLTRSMPVSEKTVEEVRTIYNETITDTVSNETVEQLAGLVAATGARFVGIDVVTRDPRMPLSDSGGVFLEINTTPGIHHHYQGEDDLREHPVAAPLLDDLLHRSTRLRAVDQELLARKESAT